MGIFLLTDFHGFAKSFFTLITKGSPPTLSISAWDNATYGHRTMQFCILTRQGGVNACALARWTHSVFCAFTFPTLVLFHQRLLDRMAYALHWCPAFNQWSPCSVSLLSALAVSCRRPYSGSVDAQRLLRLHVSYAGSPPSAIAGSNALYPSLVSGIQPMVTVQCFTAF